MPTPILQADPIEKVQTEVSSPALSQLYLARFLIESGSPDRARRILRSLLSSSDAALRAKAQIMCARLPG